ncbi:MAG: glycine cleavage system protein GcvH [Pseudomonadota bacterium]
MRKFTSDHEWVDIDGDIATIGITDYAQKALGDVVFVELPSIGATFAQKDEAGVVESVKAASEVYAPITGEVTDVNAALEDTPDLVNSAAEEGGWFFKMKLSDLSELDGLMDDAAYAELIAELD